MDADDDPTESEIAAATAEIRSRWSPTVRASRWTGHRGAIAWLPPMLPATTLPEAEEINPNA